jgi:hypothetical protein
LATFFVDRTESILRSAIGLLGDLAEAFPNGQLKEPLSSPYLRAAVVSKELNL